MRLALLEAQKAYAEDETPVGAVLLCGDTLLCAAHNRTEQLHDPCAHAEFLALGEGYRRRGSLSGCTLFVTMEPCAFCTGAMLLLKLPRLVYGAFDERAGCCGSRIDLTDHWFLHSVETYGGILEADCAGLLTSYYKAKRGASDGDIQERKK